MARGAYPFSDTYLVLDLETTDVQPTNGTILQVGYLQCIGGKAEKAQSVFLETPEDVLEQYDKGAYVAKCKREGNDGYVKAADVREKGMPRKAVLTAIKELYDSMMDIPGAILVGHNTCAFDVPFLEYFSARNGVPIKIDKDRVIDTGALFKANKMRLSIDEEQRAWDFFCWVKSIRAKGVFWRLSLAAEELDIASLFPDYDATYAHDAAADCATTHYVYRAMMDKMLAAHT